MKVIAAVAALSALLAYGNAARAQSFEAPGGDTAVTEPGGTEGRDGRHNIQEGIRDGEMVGAPRGEGIEPPRHHEGGQMKRERR